MKLFSLNGSGKSPCVSPGAASSEIVCWVICWDVIIDNATFPVPPWTTYSTYSRTRDCSQPHLLSLAIYSTGTPTLPKHSKDVPGSSSNLFKSSCSKCLEFLRMLKEHASVMIKTLGVNLVKITERRNCARQLDFQN